VEKVMSKTDDIKDSWLNPIRAAQAACKDNRGLAYVTMTVVVFKNDAVRWTEPELKKIHPARVSPTNTNEAILESILALGSLDNGNSDT
jgi:hypothetical protein